MNVLVTGATGDIGSRVVDQLLSRGVRPRVFVRDVAKARARHGERVDVAVGDLTDTATLAPALDGVDALFLVNSGHGLEARDEAAARVAKAAGVRRLVKLSTYDAQHGIGTGVWHAKGEAAIRESGVPFTFVQPSGFMSNALHWATSIRAEGVVRSATGDGAIPFIHPDDIAAVAAAALTSPEHAGASLRITGPEALSYAAMTATIGAALGRPLVFEPIPEEEARQKDLERGTAEPLAAAHVSIWRAIREGRLAAVTDGVARVLGRAPLPFTRWVEQNLAAFR
jgi:(4-alkanoyl-5-oxo-2,5-dihydrofuran-3-yl)methyl phosphate reductase